MRTLTAVSSASLVYSARYGGACAVQARTVVVGMLPAAALLR
jgi:hypothetical protein